MQDSAANPPVGTGFRLPCDRRGNAVDTTPIRRLLQAILGKWHPEQLWLFGSRARGEARGDSDWDLFVVVPDDLDDDELDPVTAWRLRKDAGVRADIVPYHAGDFVRDRDTPNTIAYEIAREGLLLYER